MAKLYVTVERGKYRYYENRANSFDDGCSSIYCLSQESAEVQIDDVTSG